MKSRNTIRKLFPIIAAAIILFSTRSVYAKGINKRAVTLRQGNSCILRISGNKRVKWSSKKKSVAAVSRTGRVFAKKPGKTSIIARAGKKRYVCRVTVLRKTTVKKTTSVKQTEAASFSKDTEIYNKLVAQKKAFPEGKYWTNLNYYRWNGGIYTGGYGCAAFVFRLSDAAFGTSSAKIHTNFNNIRVGDIVRMEYNTHSVIVLRNTGASLIVAEGNYNCTIHWGRVIPLSDVRSTGTYVMTRY